MVVSCFNCAVASWARSGRRHVRGGGLLWKVKEKISDTAPWNRLRFGGKKTWLNLSPLISKPFLFLILFHIMEVLRPVLAMILI